MASDWRPRPNIVSQLPHEAGLSRRGHGCSWYRCIGCAIAWWWRRWRRCVEICGVVAWGCVLPLWRNLATRNHGCILAHGLGFNGCFELCVASGAVAVERGVTRGCEVRIRACVCCGLVLVYRLLPPPLSPRASSHAALVCEDDMATVTQCVSCCCCSLVWLDVVANTVCSTRQTTQTKAPTQQR